MAAQSGQPETRVDELQIEHAPDGSLEASVRLQVKAPAAVRDALERGVPLYFVWQADVYRPRWYWTDKRVAGARRAYRLVYQPLTRHWRLSLSSTFDEGEGSEGLAYALHQNFNSLEAALFSIGRVSHWSIAPKGRLEPDETYQLTLRFELDHELLPRPLQFGVAAERDWRLEWTYNAELPPQQPSTPLLPASAAAEAAAGQKAPGSQK
ncbi:DUF4390 domain-containing protein [Hydrogenophaga sp. 5NK40-0174]